MMKRVVFAVAAILVGIHTSAAAQDAVIKEPEPPKTLPEGAVIYHTLTGRDAQVVFTSDAPLEKIVGKSNAVVGYAVPGPSDNPAKLAAASWLLPVKSLATGIPLRDEHMAGKDWLDAAIYPTIEFVLSKIENVKEVKRGEGFSTWSVTLVGDMTLHGVKREVRVPEARISFFNESSKTKAIGPGKLIFLKCDYTVRMSDFAIQHEDVPKKVSDEVKLSQMLRLSSATPDEIAEANKKKESSP
jgi:polyisoprenoid-binding protein YceI